jgi:hypothetical protein
MKWLPWVGFGAVVLLVLSSSRKSATVHGISITDDSIILADWTAWMVWGPSAVEDAFHDGAQGGDQVLAHLMRRSFPHRQWPPQPDDPIAESWRKMVHGLDRALRQPDEEEFDNVIPLRR